MSRKFLMILCISTCLVSCKALIAKKYGFNQEFKFKSKNEYLDYLQSVKGFDLSHVIYVDSASIDKFVMYLSENDLVEYYGTLINDSVEIKKSASLNENLKCYGRALKDIQQNLDLSNIQHNLINFSDTSLYAKSDFCKFKFRNTTTQKPYDFYSSKSRMKIFVLYSYEYGTYYDPFLKEMNDFARVHDKEVEVYIISLDYAYHFK